MSAIHELMAGLFDYAGLFPPAGLDMAKAVEEYAGYQARPDQWALGRFVVPVARLEAFESALDASPALVRPELRWPLTALLGNDPLADMAAVSLFNERHASGGPQVLSLEGKAATAAQVIAIRTTVPPNLDVYLELPLTEELPQLVEAVKAAGAYAKVRTGGVQPADIPSPETLLSFLTACADAELPFKATAGLHHPVRGVQSLTYQPDSVRASMHGFLNVFLAASALWQERLESEALALLRREDADSLVFTTDAIQWGSSSFTLAELAMARQAFAHTIGSCSFLEPVTEIRQRGAHLAALPA